MFNRKKISTLEYRIECLTRSVSTLESYLAALVSGTGDYYGLYLGLYANNYSNLNPPEQVTLNDLVADFRRTHVKVNCSSHWKPKT